MFVIASIFFCSRKFYSYFKYVEEQKNFNCDTFRILLCCSIHEEARLFIAALVLAIPSAIYFALKKPSTPFKN